MLQRLANLALGAVILTVAGAMLLFHLTSGEPARALVLLLGGFLVMGAAACFRASLVAGTDREPSQPASPAAAAEAAWRLRELKRAGSSRYRGLKGLSSLAPWKL